MLADTFRTANHLQVFLMTTLEKMKFSSFQIPSTPSCEATVTLFYIKYVQESEDRGGSTFLEIEMSIPNSKIQIANSPSNFRLIAQKMVYHGQPI